ncbi:TPA: hypothetical protein ENX78_20260 [Candidatus Poribacteria bacterium]|nr:hypothetical protein [Candidatus Poribacteria bacterium]
MEKVLILSLMVFLLINFANNGCAKTSKQDSPISEPIKFKTFQYIDKEGIGIEAFRMLIPSDWKFDGKIYWLLDNPAMPAVSAFKVTNTKGSEELEVFPNQMYFWSTNPLTLSLKPVGSRYFGAEVRQPVGPLEFLQTILIPKARNNVSNLRIVEKELVPELARQLSKMQQTPGITTTADAGKMKVEYQLNGKLYEEVFFAVIESMTYPIQSIYGVTANTNWMGDYLFSFKAEKGKLDASAKIFQAMVSSFQLNPQWFNKYNQLVEFLIRNQIQQIQTIGQISRIISQTSNEISDMMMETYQNRQSAYDRISENFSQAIRGVDSYYNPIEQRNIELPSGYKNAWTNSLGEYILSDDPTYNPNIGSNLNWQKMELKQQ